MYWCMPGWLYKLMRQQCLLQASAQVNDVKPVPTTSFSVPFKLHSVESICFYLNPFKQSGSCVTTTNYIFLKTNISFALFSAVNNHMRSGCSVFCLVSADISNSDKHQDSNS